MEKISQRDYAISTIEKLKRVCGKELFDLNGVFVMPSKEMRVFLLDKLYKPLEFEINKAYFAGFVPIRYAMWFGFNDNKKATAFGEGHANLRGKMSHNIEWGISETIEEHEKMPRPLELMLYVKANEDDLLVIPDDVFSRELVLNLTSPIGSSGNLVIFNKVNLSKIK